MINDQWSMINDWWSRIIDQWSTINDQSSRQLRPPVDASREEGDAVAGQGISALARECRWEGWWEDWLKDWWEEGWEDWWGGLVDECVWCSGTSGRLTWGHLGQILTFWSKRPNVSLKCPNLLPLFIFWTLLDKILISRVKPSIKNG